MATIEFDKNIKVSDGNSFNGNLSGNATSATIASTLEGYNITDTDGNDGVTFETLVKNSRNCAVRIREGADIKILETQLPPTSRGFFASTSNSGITTLMLVDPKGVVYSAYGKNTEWGNPETFAWENIRTSDSLGKADGVSGITASADEDTPVWFTYGNGSDDSIIRGIDNSFTYNAKKDVLKVGTVVSTVVGKVVGSVEGHATSLVSQSVSNNTELASLIKARQSCAVTFTESNTTSLGGTSIPAGRGFLAVTSGANSSYMFSLTMVATTGVIYSVFGTLSKDANAISADLLDSSKVKVRQSDAASFVSATQATATQGKNRYVWFGDTALGAGINARCYDTNFLYNPDGAQLTLGNLTINGTDGTITELTNNSTYKNLKCARGYVSITTDDQFKTSKLTLKDSTGAAVTFTGSDLHVVGITLTTKDGEISGISSSRMATHSESSRDVEYNIVTCSGNNLAEDGMSQENAILHTRIYGGKLYLYINSAYMLKHYYFDHGVTESLNAIFNPSIDCTVWYI